MEINDVATVLHNKVGRTVNVKEAFIVPCMNNRIKAPYVGNL